MQNKINSSQIFDLAGKSFARNFKFLLLITVFFIALSSLLFMAFFMTTESVGMMFLGAFLLVVAYAKLAVMVHRAVLLDETNWSSLWRWTNDELSFTFKAIGLGLAAIFMFWVVMNALFSGGGQGPSGFTTLLILAFMITLGIIFSRIVLIFPATAVGDPLEIKTSWVLTKNSKLSLFFLVILFPYVTNRLLEKVPDGDWLWLFFVQFITVLVTIFEVTMVSHCYEQLKADEGVEAEEAESTKVIT